MPNFKHSDARIITHGLSISPEHESAIHQAVGFARCAHRNQKRRYTDEAYINHPIAVARLVATHGADIDTIIAAVLHDVIEDTDVSAEALEAQFGNRVMVLVLEVTKGFESLIAEQPRTRESLSKAYLHLLSKTSPEAATIKLADIIDNTSTLHERDPKRALTYLPEKWDALEVLGHGHAVLWERALHQISDNLLAAKNTVYPLPLKPHFFEDGSPKIYCYEGDYFAKAKLEDDAYVLIHWNRNAWEHSNASWGKVLWNGGAVSPEVLAKAGIPT
jgi:hypothetical protein